MKKQGLWILALLWAFVPEVWVLPAYAAPLQFKDVLTTMFNKSPDLQSSRLQTKMREAETAQVEGALDMRYGANAGISNEKAPTTSPFAATETNAAFVAGNVVKPFADGSTLTGTLKYNRAELIYPASVNPAFQSSPNPLYQHQIDLTYRYPLAAGKGNPNYTFQKEAGDAEEKAAGLRVAVLKEQLAAQAIGLYAQFVLNDLSVEVAEDAVLRAKQLLNNQKKRENFGLVEKEDRYQTEALVAARKLQLAQAVAAEKSAQTALNRLMYQDADTPLSVSFAAPEVRITSVADMLNKAQAKRPIFQVLDAQYAAAESRLSMVQSAGDYQLDLVGQVGTRALDGSAGTAFAQGFTVDDRYIGLSVEFSDVVGNKGNRATIEKNVLVLESIQIERSKARLDLESEIAKLVDAIRSAETTLKASAKQVQAERKKYRAQVARYKKGRTPTSVVIQFEGDLRAAELRYLIQQVNKGVSEYQLALAMGELASLNPASGEPQ